MRAQAERSRTGDFPSGNGTDRTQPAPLRDPLLRGSRSPEPPEVDERNTGQKKTGARQQFPDRVQRRPGLCTGTHAGGLVSLFQAAQTSPTSPPEEQAPLKDKPDQ